MNDLRERREALGMTQSDLAEKAGVHRNTIRNVEAGMGTAHTHRMLDSILRKAEGREPLDPGEEPPRVAPLMIRANIKVEGPLVVALLGLIETATAHLNNREE